VQLHAGVKISTTGGSRSAIYIDHKSHAGKAKFTLQPQNEVCTSSSKLCLLSAVLTHLRSTSSRAGMKFPPKLFGLLMSQMARRLFAKEGPETKNRYGYAKADAPVAEEELAWYWSSLDR
jgi:hypothetical protein